MSAVVPKADVPGHVRTRVEALRQAASGHVDATTGAVKTEIDTVVMVVGDLLSLKPVQAVADLVKGTSEAVLDRLLQDNIAITAQHAKRQAQIAREGRI